MSSHSIYLHIISRNKAKELGMSRYFTGKPCKHGHISERMVTNHGCAECSRLACSDYSKKYREKERKRNKEYRNKNPDKASRWSRASYHRNREDILERNKEWREDNKEKKKDTDTKYYRKNRDKVLLTNRRWKENNRDRYNRYFRDRRKNPQIKLTERCREMIHRTLNLIGKNKDESTFQLLGYTAEELKNHLESLFIDGMSWENFGEWHIDHIYPINRFINEGITDPAVINSLSNLRPMWAEDNIAKGNLLFEEWMKINPDRATLYM